MFFLFSYGFSYGLLQKLPPTESLNEWRIVGGPWLPRNSHDFSSVPSGNLLHDVAIEFMAHKK